MDICGINDFTVNIDLYRVVLLTTNIYYRMTTYWRRQK